MNRSFNTISIIGLGYIGLPTAAVFASKKVKVIGVDVNQHAVDTINRGEIHIVEPELDLAVQAAVKDGYLRASTQAEPADAFIIAVPTPFKDGSTGPHHPDMDYIEAASKSIAPVLKKGDLVILESTSPVGATEQMATWLAEVRPDLKFPHTHGETSDIRIAHCPERVLPGQVLRELVENDRVIGGITPMCSEAAAHLYKIFVMGECVITTARTAEMCKLTENSFRDVNIAFANELSVICDKLDINVWELIRLANRHPRVEILSPGAGVGGHCIAVDPWFIVSSAPEEAKLIRCAREVNSSKPKWVISKINEISKQLNLEKPKVVCLGLTFKPNIDDIRESPALEIVEELINNSDFDIRVVEPNVKGEVLRAIGIEMFGLVESIKWADLVVVLVGHLNFIGVRELAENYGKIFYDVQGDI
jgi:UDP-N-acetyl-D-mannosaminuronic acid dehydrogenase